MQEHCFFQLSKYTFFKFLCLEDILYSLENVTDIMDFLIFFDAFFVKPICITESFRLFQLLKSSQNPKCSPGGRVTKAPKCCF